MSTLRTRIIADIDAYLTETGMSDSRLGREALGDSHLVRHLRMGRGTQLDRLERLEEWMTAERSRRVRVPELALAA